MKLEGNYMKKICLVDSTYPINTRTNKIYNSLVNDFGRENVSIIAWNRDGRESKYFENYYIFEKKAAYGNKVQKLINLFSFKKYIKKVLDKNNFDVIIASHWETLLLASKLKRANTKLIYENLDIPTASNKLILNILQKIEKKALKKTDAIVFASRFFIPLYDFFIKEKILLENKPDKQLILPEMKIHNSFNVVFLGVIRYLDILKNLVDSVNKTNGIKLVIWGDGPDYANLKKYAEGKANIFIRGRYENSQLANIYSEADLVWAVYPNNDYNVKYAISNKFHESINIGKPCIYAEKTELGNFVSSNRIGFVVNPYSVDDITELLDKLKANPKLIEEATNKLKMFKKKETSWNDDFSKLGNFIRR